jgi:CYTH domain-containing protein
MAANDREIERKFLLRSLPERARGAKSVEVDQGYLPGTRINERIRRMRFSDRARYFRTIKTGAGLERMELEEETSEEFFTTVWPLTRGARIFKRRYFVPEGEVVWEIDEFLDRSGLWLAEVELQSVDQRIKIPEWLEPAIEREVTEEREYTNHALAK